MAGKGYDTQQTKGDAVVHDRVGKNNYEQRPGNL